MLLALLMGIFAQISAPISCADPVSSSIDVSFLTQTGSLKLKTWNHADLKHISRSGGQISAQKMIFDESTQTLDLNDRADIDIVTITGDDRTARVPRFMVWRGFLKLSLAKDGSLSARGDANRLLVPGSIFSVTKIRKIELSRASFLYPDTELHLRTNPAASRGEKLFTQSCLACHSLNTAPKLKVEAITDVMLNDFSAKHKSQGGISLDARALRGLIAYREALVAEHSEVKSLNDSVSKPVPSPSAH